jgi:hypothetical protein
VLARAPAQASSILLSSSTGLIQRQLLNYFQTRLPNPPTHPCVPDSLVPTLADYLRSSLNPCSVDPRGTDDVDHSSRTSHQQLLLCLYTVGKMSEYYPPNQHIPPQYYNTHPNVAQNPNIPHVPSMMGPDRSIPHGMLETPSYPGMPVPFVQYAEPQMQQAYMDQYEDLPGNIGSAQAGQARMRRRTAPGDNVKHRRTRSGCFTCRQRRVKVSLLPSLYILELLLIAEYSVMKVIQYARVSLASLVLCKLAAELIIFCFRMSQRKP